VKKKKNIILLPQNHLLSLAAIAVKLILDSNDILDLIHIIQQLKKSFPMFGKMQLDIIMNFD
jgi:hypothetical protein